MRFVLAVLVVSLSASVASTQTFQAVLNSDGVIRGGVQGTASQATGFATFELSQPTNGPVTLSYQIELNNADLAGQNLDPLDDVTAIHLHDVTRCVPNIGCLPGDRAGTYHVLNIFGIPRQDDAELVVDAANSTLSGIWDDSDATMLPVDSPWLWSVPISDPMTLATLMNGEMALMLHTQEVPSGAIGGILTLVPEPTNSWTVWLMVAACFGCCRVKRRRSLFK